MIAHDGGGAGCGGMIPSVAQVDDQTAPMKSSSRPAPLPVVLRAVGERVASFRLSTGVCLIGTSKGAHLRVEEATVSRQHCEVELTPEGVVVSDLQSRNGTFYLGRKVDRIVLGPGASFAIGSVQIVIESGLERGAVEPSSVAELGGLSGDSLPMRRLMGLIQRLGGSLVPVLIEGESGVGKSTSARAIHETSPVAAGQFVVMPCASIPKDAQAAELSSALERAARGTLYLRSVDALALELQPRLLDAMESSIEVRVVASTTRPLEEEVAAARFHHGLYYRLAPVRLMVPPLRDRREDIATLARKISGDGAELLTPEILADLTVRPWPGNVRELRGILAALAALGALPSASRPRGALLPLALDELVDVRRPYTEQKDALTDQFTERYLKALLAHTDGNQSVAAKLAGLDRSYLGKLMAKMGLKG